MITLARRASHALEVRRSRFVAHAAPADAPAAALAFLGEISDPGATHNCWAYRIGDAYRSCDDGEPGGTAGRPILQAIDAQGLDRVVVVVARWFGGVKLGAGGLVRAYGGCAAECLRLAPRVEVVPCVLLELSCRAGDLGAVHALLARHGAAKLAESYADGDRARIRVEVAASRRAALASALLDATRGRARVLDAAQGEATVR